MATKILPVTLVDPPIFSAPTPSVLSPLGMPRTELKTFMSTFTEDLAQKQSQTIREMRQLAQETITQTEKQIHHKVTEPSPIIETPATPIYSPPPPTEVKNTI
jgi:predicted RecB family nuclease